MPLYEYKCKACKQVFEVMQKFSDAPLTTHEGCGGAVERLISSPALQFKGSGWYVTDYARSSSATASEAAKSSGNGDATAKKISESSKPTESAKSPSAKA
jgi:putative FmdB family regulatory protein